ncbi:MAG: NADH:ubiquinone reductase (Na(+)-transporting) subunit D [Flavobacteriales bacterium]|nr:NADH:ubiquinone reductase (Na(+)-transporting) subunit D [Flavobacteriales bacterium]MCX7650943.1 NADH:ubiquinone reductase (Na(+)-transporting) subunit D [Flavobacteriales bacterium]MDW8432987.1 NADH:ubiquinone reductase (Na(+)-transporting) subunit D [Flavobacteriales bacterium]
MTTQAATSVKKEKEALFSRKNLKLLKDPLNDNNPVTVQVLGICSALAVTVQVKPSFYMCMGVLFVVAMGNVVISAIRNFIPNRVRIIAQLVVVAGLVTIVDQVLKAYAYDMSKKLSVFVGLIITNCIVMGRLEAFAMGNRVWPSLLDGIGNALGYSVILMIVATVREIFGSGTFWGIRLIPSSLYATESSAGYVNNGMMLLPPMALIIVGIIIWVQRGTNKKLIEKPE